MSLDLDLTCLKCKCELTIIGRPDQKDTGLAQQTSRIPLSRTMPHVESSRSESTGKLIKEPCQNQTTWPLVNNEARQYDFLCSGAQSTKYRMMRWPSVNTSARPETSKLSKTFVIET